MAGELALPDALHHEATRGIVKELVVHGNSLQKIYMMGPGSANVISRTGSKGSEDTFDDARTVPSVVSAGADYPAGSAQPVGTFPWRALRVAEEIRHHGDDLVMLRAIGGPDSERDRQGRRYQVQQLGTQRQRFSLLRDAAIAGVLFDRLYMKPSDGRFLPTYTAAGAIPFPTQIPAAHKTDVGGIIATSWNNAAAPIVADAEAIIAKGIEDCGLAPLTWLWNSTTWAATILINTQLKDLAGTSNQIWTEIDRDDDTGVRRVVLAGMPNVTHYIVDQMVTLDGTTTKMVPDNMVAATPNPNAMQGWFQMIEGSDYYSVNGDDAPDVEINGQVFYYRKDGSKVSSVIQQRANDLFTPVPRVPKAFFPMTPVF